MITLHYIYFFSILKLVWYKSERLPYFHRSSPLNFLQEKKQEMKIFPSANALRNILLEHTYCFLQCCGSVTFWYGSGSANPYLWLADSDPDPAIFVSDLQDVFSTYFCLLLFEATYTSFFKDKKSLKITKQLESRFFLLFLLDERRILIRTSYKRIWIRGSGSATLVSSQCTLFFSRLCCQWEDKASMILRPSGSASKIGWVSTPWSILDSIKIRRLALGDRSAIHRVACFVLFPAVTNQITECLNLPPPPLSPESLCWRRFRKVVSSRGLVITLSMNFSSWKLFVFFEYFSFFLTKKINKININWSVIDVNCLPHRRYHERYADL